MILSPLSEQLNNQINHWLIRGLNDWFHFLFEIGMITNYTKQRILIDSYLLYYLKPQGKSNFYIFLHQWNNFWSFPFIGSLSKFEIWCWKGHLSINGAIFWTRKYIMLYGCLNEYAIIYKCHHHTNWLIPVMWNLQKSPSMKFIFQIQAWCFRSTFSPAACTLPSKCLHSNDI